MSTDRIRGAVDAHSDRRRGGLPGRTFAAQEKAQAWDMLRSRGGALRKELKNARRQAAADQAAKTDIAGATRSALTVAALSRW